MTQYNTANVELSEVTFIIKQPLSSNMKTENATSFQHKIWITDKQ